MEYARRRYFGAAVHILSLGQEFIEHLVPIVLFFHKMRLGENSHEIRFLMQELHSSLRSCSDLASALRCLREVFQRVVPVEDLVLLVKTPESPQVTCVSQDGSFQLEDCLVDKIPLGLPADCHDETDDSLLYGFTEPESASGMVRYDHLNFTAKGYQVFPLQGMAECFVALGVLFAGGQSEAVFFQQLATSLGIALDNVILRERLARLRGALKGALQHVSGMRDVALTAISQPTLQDLVDGISANVRKRFGTEILCLLRYRPESKDMLWAAMHFPNGMGPRVVGTTTSVTHTRNGGTIAIKTQKPVLADRNMLEQTANENCISTLLALRAKTYYAVPLIYGGKVIGVLSPAHVTRNYFSSEELSLWDDCATQVSLALKCLSGQQLNCSISEREDIPNLRRYEVNKRVPALGLIGTSPAFQKVLSQVNVVASTDSSVLLTGETGTGKGVLAEAIHRLSFRSSKPFVVINCAAIPATLLESEMFGYERGAFTGANIRHAGRLEQANGGTVFFDEIGELPLELQPKLLRAIQEQRIERLGGGTSVQLNVRFIWATNRKLEQMVADKLFRSDLYYRISVFPISVPSLSDRQDDIEALSYHFLKQCNQKMNKQIENISPESLQILQNRTWPGNIRELCNVIERAAILTTGKSLDLSFEAQTTDMVRLSTYASTEIRHRTWKEIERANLFQVLSESNGVIADAAKRLHLKRTTLDSRLRRVGITQAQLTAMRSGVNA